MAQVIHTRKGKYHYLYNHTRVNGKVVSTYLCPCNSTGDKRVAQETEPITREKDSLVEAAQERKIIVGKQATYDGTKVIEYEYDPFDSSGKFNPMPVEYEIRKYKNDKEWGVYKITQGTKATDYKKVEKYCGTDSLKECRRYCNEKLEKVSQSEKS